MVVIDLSQLLQNISLQMTTNPRMTEV